MKKKRPTTMLKKILITAMGGLLLATVGTTAAANAGTSPIPSPIGGEITLTVSDVQYGAGGDCVYAPVKVSIWTPDDYAYYDWEFTSTYDGPTSWPDEISGTGYYSGTTNDSFIICPEYDSPGTYTGYLDVTFYDYDGWEITTAYASDSFRVSAYPVSHSSSLSSNVIKTGVHGWTIRTTSTYDGHAWAGHKVNFQKKYSGSWHTVKSVWTNSNGRANYALTPTAGPAKPYRAVLTAGPGVNQKVSRVYWLKRR